MAYGQKNIARQQANGRAGNTVVLERVFNCAFYAGCSMKKLEEIVSADSRFRVEFFERDDGTHGYDEFKNTNNAASPLWCLHSKSDSRFESQQTAFHEAQQRLPWLRKEREWLARDKESIVTTEYIPGWMVCPFCGVRFSLCDADRWGGDRHLTCGQRIIKAVPG
jgi:hypothetical protein